MGRVFMELLPTKGIVVFLMSVSMGYLFPGTAVGLQVEVTPSVIQQYQGTSIEIQCSVRNIEAGFQLLPYWIHMDRFVAVSKLTKPPYNVRSTIAAYYYIGGLDYILKIRNVMPGDAGAYICHIRYGGNIFQDSATVTVLQSPSLPSCSPNGSVSIMEGSLLAMSCSSDVVASPDDLMVHWQPPTDAPHTGPADSDWTVSEAQENQTVQKQLTVAADAGYNNSWFMCTAAREDESPSVVVFESCIIGPITVLPTPPEITISVQVLHPQFPLQDGNAARFTCQVNRTQTPVVLGPTLETSWNLSPKIDPERVYYSNLPGSRSIVIKISHQDNGAIVSCVLSYKGDTYRDNVTLVVSPVLGLTTVESQSAASDANPTAAITATLTEGPPTPQNQPWYSNPVVIIPIALSVAVLLFLVVILINCVMISRRRKRRRETKREEAELQEFSRYPPLALHQRPTSENIYHELSDETPPPDEARDEMPYSTGPEAEQPYSECTSPQPQLEVYAETVENILYVPSVGNPGDAARRAVGPSQVGNYENATIRSTDLQEGTSTYAAVI